MATGAKTGLRKPAPTCPQVRRDPGREPQRQRHDWLRCRNRAESGQERRTEGRAGRGILKSGWGLLAGRLEQKASGRVEKVKAAYTSQTCNTCKHIASESPKSQATFVCVACGHRANADVNAARNIAAGHADRKSTRLN